MVSSFSFEVPSGVKNLTHRAGAGRSGWAGHSMPCDYLWHTTVNGMACCLSRIRKLTKKELYVYVSLFLALFLSVTIITDLVAYTISEKTSHTTQNLTETLLVSLVVVVAFCLLRIILFKRKQKQRALYYCSLEKVYLITFPMLLYQCLR